MHACVKQFHIHKNLVLFEQEVGFIDISPHDIGSVCVYVFGGLDPFSVINIGTSSGTEVRVTPAAHLSATLLC